MLTNFLGKDRTIGIYQIIYDLTRKKISTITEYSKRFDKNRKKFAKKQSDKDLLEYGPIDEIDDIADDIAYIYLGFTGAGESYDLIDCNVIKEDIGIIKIKLSITFAWTGGGGLNRQIDNIIEIFSYGVCKLNNELELDIRNVFDDQLVDEQFTVSLTKSSVTLSHKSEDKLPLTVDHYFTIMDEAAVLPGGKDYLKAKKQFENAQQ